MNGNSFEQKSYLQELDPIELDALLAISFDWREMANRLSMFGRNIPHCGYGVLSLPQTVFRMAQSAIQNDIEFSGSIERELNRRHGRFLEMVSSMEAAEICALVQDTLLNSRAETGGFLWALLTDSRECIQKFSGVFLQKILTDVFSSHFSV